MGPRLPVPRHSHHSDSSRSGRASAQRHEAASRIGTDGRGFATQGFLACPLPSGPRAALPTGGRGGLRLGRLAIRFDEDVVSWLRPAPRSRSRAAARHPGMLKVRNRGG